MHHGIASQGLEALRRKATSVLIWNSRATRQATKLTRGRDGNLLRRFSSFCSLPTLLRRGRRSNFLWWLIITQGFQRRRELLVLVQPTAFLTFCWYLGATDKNNSSSTWGNYYLVWSSLISFRVFLRPLVLDSFTPTIASIPRNVDYP